MWVCVNSTCWLRFLIILFSLVWSENTKISRFDDENWNNYIISGEKEKQVGTHFGPKSQNISRSLATHQMIRTRTCWNSLTGVEQSKTYKVFSKIYTFAFESFRLCKQKGVGGCSVARSTSSVLLKWSLKCIWCPEAVPYNSNHNHKFQEQ
jgi:hypothetical protein